MQDNTHDAIVVGAGVAGLAAAKALQASGRTTALVDDGMLGGLIVNVGRLEGASSFVGQSGADVVNQLLGEALEGGVDYLMGAVEAVTQAEGGWRVTGLEVAAPMLVVATGAAMRTLGVPGEERLSGRGVSQCAFCDGGLYRGRPAAVVGGGDAAFQEAAHLAEIGVETTLLVRGDRPKAREALVEQAAGQTNMTIRYGVRVLEIEGEDGVASLRLGVAGAEERLAVNAVFPFVGLTPATAAVPAGATQNADGALVVDAKLQTNLPGLYAVGAVRAGFGGDVADALADAETVAS